MVKETLVRQTGDTYYPEGMVAEQMLQSSSYRIHDY